MLRPPTGFNPVSGARNTQISSTGGLDAIQSAPSVMPLGFRVVKPEICSIDKSWLRSLSEYNDRVQDSRTMAGWFLGMVMTITVEPWILGVQMPSLAQILSLVFFVNALWFYNDSRKAIKRGGEIMKKIEEAKEEIVYYVPAQSTPPAPHTEPTQPSEVPSTHHGI